MILRIIMIITIVSVVIYIAFSEITYRISKHKNRGGNQDANKSNVA